MKKSKTAVITGITGQDAAYLAQLLLDKGYQVFGAYRRTSSVNFWRLQQLDIAQHDFLHLVEYDLTDLGSSVRLLQATEPDEVYNLALLIGHATKAREKLGWAPHTTLEQLCQMMVEADVRRNHAGFSF